MKLGLTRRDLCSDRSDKKIEDVSIQDFRGITWDLVTKVDSIVFVDTNKDMKFIKSRTLEHNTIVRFGQFFNCSENAV